MPYVGAFMSQVGGAIPTGYGDVVFNWTTTDGSYPTCVFEYTGPVSGSVESDANGRAKIRLPTGRYTFTPIHDGRFVGDIPKVVDVPNKEEISVNWVASPAFEQATTFLNGTPLKGEQYTVYDSDRGIAATGIWTDPMILNLFPGKYTIEFTHYAPIVYPFEVPTSFGLTIDCTDWFATITVNAVTRANISYNGVSIASNAATATIQVYKESVSRRIQANLLIESYSGLVTTPVCTATTTTPYLDIIPDRNQTLTIGEVKGTKIEITADGSITLPSGKYDILVMGGGGMGGTFASGSIYSTGGGGGFFEYRERLSLQGQYTVTIGKGGSSSDNPAGGPTSFGSVLSAAGGGSGATGGIGGSCGGIGGRNISGTVFTGGDGGTGAGGASGGKGSSSTGVAGGRGSVGTVIFDPEDIRYYESDSAGGAGSVTYTITSTSTEIYGGAGGGGGGICAKGGSGGSGDRYVVKAGGGGGGIAGGDGGPAGIYTTNWDYHPTQYTYIGGGGGGGYGPTGIGGFGASDPLIYSAGDGGIGAGGGGGVPRHGWGSGNYDQRSPGRGGPGIVVLKWRGI